MLRINIGLSTPGTLSINMKQRIPFFVTDQSINFKSLKDYTDWMNSAIEFWIIYRFTEPILVDTIAVSVKNEMVMRVHC